MKSILKNEWRLVSRNRWFAITGLVLAGILVLSSYLGVQEAKQLQLLAQESSEHIREQWDSQEAGNPHNAAHYGTYLFKPSGALAGFDEGINGVVGKTLYLEGHRQNNSQFSEASQSLLATRFGKLRPALLLQLIVPFLLIFMVFSSISQERESDRIRLLVLQGGNLRSIIFSKVLFYWLIGVFLVVISLFLQFILFPSVGESVLGLRVLIIFLSYAAFYWIICGLTAYLTTQLRKASTALSIMIGVWILWGVFLPKIMGNLAEEYYQLPTRTEFTAAMKADREAGFDGHNPEDDKIEAIKDSVLRHYQVETVDQLPINFDGIRMQADEEFGNKVWDTHFGEMYSVLNRQKSFIQASSIPNPFQSLQSLSMGWSGTDQASQIDFLLEAEDYRREFIGTLNEEHALGGSLTGDWSWKADQKFFQSMADFEYATLPSKTIFNSTWPDLLILFFWAGISSLLIYSIRFKL